MVSSIRSPSFQCEQDAVTEELAVVLSRKASFEFKPLFALVLANLRARNFTGSGDEMLWLSTYERLQYLVGQHMVETTISKHGKQYHGLAALASVLPASQAKPTRVL